MRLGAEMRRRSIAAIQVRLMHRDEATIHRRNPSQTDAPSNITCASATFVCKEHACVVCGRSSTQPDAPSNLTCAAMKPVQSHCQILFRLSQSCRYLLPGAALQPRTPQRARATELLTSHSCTYRPSLTSPTITIALPHVIAASP